MKKKLLGGAGPEPAEIAGTKKRKASNSEDAEEKPATKKRGRKTKAAATPESTADNPRYPDQYDYPHDSAHDSPPTAEDDNTAVDENQETKIKNETEEGANEPVNDDGAGLKPSANYNIGPDAMHHGIEQEGNDES